MSLTSWFTRKPWVRCEWRTWPHPNGAQCIRNQTHRGYCVTAYTNGASKAWRGVNFEEGTAL